MHKQCSPLFYSPMFIPEDKPLHTLMTKNTYILLFNMPTHLCLYHNINPFHTLMTKVKARHFTASTDNLTQKLSIYIYIYTHIYFIFFHLFSKQFKFDCKGFTQRNYPTPTKPEKKNPNCSTQLEKPMINNPNSINGNTNKPSQTK